MKGSYNHGTAEYTVTWSFNGEQLRSPDGTKQLLPCEHCGECQWVETNVVAYLCQKCAAIDNPCDMCNHYDSPGFILNAGQVIPCFQCNQNNVRGFLSVPATVRERVRDAKA